MPKPIPTAQQQAAEARALAERVPCARCGELVHPLVLEDGKMCGVCYTATEDTRPKLRLEP